MATGYGARMPNVEFYSGRLKSPEGKIHELHAWFGQYWRLEMNHQYIQWLFPNKFASQYNANSHSLTDAEAREFRRDAKIGERYAQSYRMFTDFLGLEVANWATGELRVVAPDRLRIALFENPHNQLRIRRVLASMAAIGFQGYMQPLVQLLNKEMQSRNGILRELKTDQSKWATDGAPWEVYSNYVKRDTFFQNTQVRWEDAQEDSQWLKECKDGQHPQGPMCYKAGGTNVASSFKPIEVVCGFFQTFFRSLCSGGCTDQQEPRRAPPRALSRVRVAGKPRIPSSRLGGGIEVRPRHSP